MSSFDYPPKDTQDLGEVEEKKHRPSAIVRVAGPATEEVLQKIDLANGDVLGKDSPVPAESLGRFTGPMNEMKKTPEQIETLEQVFEGIRELCAKFGIKPVEMTPDSVITSIETVSTPENEGMHGGFKLYTHNFVSIDLQKMQESKRYPEGMPMIVFAQMVFHELVHRNGHNAMGAYYDKNGRPRLIQKRTGLKMAKIDSNLFDSDGLPTGHHFNFLNEAITDELALRFIQRNDFKGALGKAASEMQQIKEMIKNRPGILEKWGLENATPEEVNDAFNEKMYFFGPNDVDGNPKPDGVSAYQDERRFLKKLIAEIYNKNKEEFKDRDAVFDLFVKAAMTETGVISLARLIDKTFGEGSFRRLKGIRPKTAEAFFAGK